MVGRVILITIVCRAWSRAQMRTAAVDVSHNQDARALSGLQRYGEALALLEQVSAWEADREARPAASPSLASRSVRASTL